MQHWDTLIGILDTGLRYLALGEPLLGTLGERWRCGRSLRDSARASMAVSG